MSYGHDYRNRSYPDPSYGPTDNMTDEMQIVGLGPREGDTDASHKTLNHPWGKVVHLVPSPTTNGTLKGVTAVQTEVAPRPFPWAIQARYSRDGITYSPTIPAGWTGQLVIDIVKSFDVKTGPMRERFILDPGDGLPICALISRSLTVNVSLLGENSLELWVALVVCPTTQIDCDALTPVAPTQPPAGITSTATARYPAVGASTYNIAASPTRGLLVIVNQSARNLFIHLGAGVVVTVGSEFATVVLPANAFAGYETTDYRGEIYFRFDGDDGAGYALVTEGFY